MPDFLLIPDAFCSPSPSWKALRTSGEECWPFCAHVCISWRKGRVKRSNEEVTATATETGKSDALSSARRLKTLWSHWLLLGMWGETWIKGSRRVSKVLPRCTSVAWNAGGVHVSQPCREVLGLPWDWGGFTVPAAGGGQEERVLWAARHGLCFRGALQGPGPAPFSHFFPLALCAKRASLLLCGWGQKGIFGLVFFGFFAWSGVHCEMHLSKSPSPNQIAGFCKGCPQGRQV